MKHIRSLLIIAISVLLAQSARAELVRFAPIDITGTGNLGADATTGTLEGWGNSTSQVTVTNGVASLNGTGLGLLASSGSRAFASATYSINARNQFVGSGAFPQTVDTNVYYSFLYKFDNASDVDAAGELIVRVNRANSGTGTPQHWDLIARNAGGQIQLGLFQANATVTNWTTTNINVGAVTLVVVRQQIFAGPDNDIVDLWINPPAATLGVDEGSIPPPAVSTSDGVEDTSNTGPGRMVFASGVNSEFDELRVGTTWHDVTPALGSCDSAAVTSDPTNATVVADIPATFRMTATGTAAEYSWEVSTNSGSTWDVIPGATLLTYTTPNTTLADNGNQYRGLATTACDMSSATSAVATLTVTAPVITPTGLLMDDLFDDGFRDNLPFSSVNSIWRASSTDSIDASFGDLVLTPYTGSSRLWIGYFRDPTASPMVPADIAIGTGIKVTFPFSPKDTMGTNGASGMRFGIYDYSDGDAGPVTADGGSGSGGGAQGVRGYLMTLNWGTNFTQDTPISILARNALDDVNLMGTTGDYDSLGTGPGGMSNAPAFALDGNYVLTMTVARTGEHSVDVTTEISGLSSNMTFTVSDSTYAYHRFDSFAFRANTLEQTAGWFVIPEYKVEVIDVALPITSLPPYQITEVQKLSATDLKMTWESTNGVTYNVLSSTSLNPAVWVTNATVVATGPTTSYTNSPISGAQTFYRVEAPLPQTLP